MTENLLEQRRTVWVVVAFIAVLFAIANLPWQLDDYDQAKQAFTSFEMVKEGRWLYQHTPHQRMATKPPLVGWISAAVFGVTRSWEIAWRLPSLIAAFALAWVLGQAAKRTYGKLAAVVAVSAFALNLLSPRLATLVRTDMPLALVIFLIGLVIWQKVREATPWELRDQAYVFLLLTAAMLIKGPIVYAFLLPGIALFQLQRVRTRTPDAPKRYLDCAWPGWWPWVVSLAIFLIWVAGGIRFHPGFYQEVVMREFIGRFGETIHRPQPLLFYLPHLLHKFAPWSVLILAIALFELRSRHWRLHCVLQEMSPGVLWLLCWSIGGLIVMSLIPSKRVDRIFPVIPPLCLLLAAQVAPQNSHSHRPVRRPSRLRVSNAQLGIIALGFAVLFTGGYTGWKVITGYRDQRNALAVFGRNVRHEAEARHWRYAIVSARDEGLLLYLRKTHFVEPLTAVTEWNSGRLDAIIASKDKATVLMSDLKDAVLSPLQSNQRPEQQQGRGYVLIARQASAGVDTHVPRNRRSNSTRRIRADSLISREQQENARSTLERRILVSVAKQMSNEKFPGKEMETLWAPWRVEYFEKEPRDRDFLATAGRASDDSEHLVITRRKNSFLMMNRYPYAVGHLMAVPYRKVAEISALGDNEITELWSLLVHAQALLRATVKAQGFNIGVNLGACAGAGVPDHLHIHVVPRWAGDTNFMPIIGGTRVLSDGLRALYDKIMEAQAKMTAPT